MPKKCLVRNLIKWNKRKLLKELKEERKRNRLGNLRFIDIHVAWLKRTSNKDWTKRQKELMDDAYNSNRKLRLNLKGKSIKS